MGRVGGWGTDEVPGLLEAPDGFWAQKQHDHHELKGREDTGVHRRGKEASQDAVLIIQAQDSSHGISVQRSGNDIIETRRVGVVSVGRYSSERWCQRPAQNEEGNRIHLMG